MENSKISEQTLAADPELTMLKNFLQRYGRYMLIALIIMSLTMIGYNVVRKNKENKSREASTLYDMMLKAVESADKDKATLLGKQILSDYKRTPYALLSSMLLAKFLVDGGDFDGAIAQLQQITTKTYYKDPLWHIAKARLARLLHSIGKDDLALKELENDADDYVALYEEIKGDIYVKSNDYNKAHAAYEKAIASTMSDNKTWLNAKLAEIASAVTDGAKDQGSSKENINATNVGVDSVSSSNEHGDNNSVANNSKPVEGN